MSSRDPKLTAAQATLRVLLREHGGRREEVAKLLRTTPSTLDNLEIGRVRAHVLARVAAALDELARAGT